MIFELILHLSEVKVKTEYSKYLKITTHNIGLKGAKMDCMDVMKERRSVRSYLKKDVEEEDLEDILWAGQLAPSGGNLQAREFIVVKRRELKEGLVEAAFGQTFIGEAPVIIVVCANIPESSKRYGERGVLFSIQDASASVMNILLAAHEKGLSTCWAGAFDEERVREVLDIPKEIKPIAIIPIGYGGEKPKMPRRKPLKEVTHYDGW